MDKWLDDGIINTIREQYPSLKVFEIEHSYCVLSIDSDNDGHYAMLETIWTNDTLIVQFYQLVKIIKKFQEINHVFLVVTVSQKIPTETEPFLTEFFRIASASSLLMGESDWIKQLEKKNFQWDKPLSLKLVFSFTD